MVCSANGFNWRPFSEIQWMAVKKDVTIGSAHISLFWVAGLGSLLAQSAIQVDH